MKAAILIPVLTSKDAVGADALAMAQILDDLGIETRVFCLSSTDVERKTWPAERLPAFASGPRDLVIYHYSTGWPAALEILGQCRGFRVVKYHNITPAAFFKDYSADYQAACEAGRRELSTMARLGCELYLGDSAYNLDELIDAGAPRERGGVLSPFHRVEEIVEVEADTQMVDTLTDGARNFLMVGRVAPNKGHLDLVEAFAAYVRGYSDSARLILLGKIDPRLESYTNAVRDRIETYGVGHQVVWINGASEAQLKAAYLASHVFMLLSQHEGFCVPLIESMAVGTPIVAHASSAVPETLGDAGICWEENDPWLYAASADRIFRDDDLRNNLIETARQRYQDNYIVDVLRRRFLEHLAPVL